MAGSILIGSTVVSIATYSTFLDGFFSVTSTISTDIIPASGSLVIDSINVSSIPASTAGSSMMVAGILISVASNDEYLNVYATLSSTVYTTVPSTTDSSTIRSDSLFGG